MPAPENRGRGGGRSRRSAGLPAALILAMLTMSVLATPTGAASSGSVDAQVTVSQSAACLEIDLTSISFGTLGLGVQGTATPQFTVFNCSSDSTGTLMASGTNATGTNATWNLVDSTETCADTLGTDNYHLGVSTDVPGVTWLGGTNKELVSLPADIGIVQEASIYTACPGSSGAGETMSMQINYVMTGGGSSGGGLEPLPDTQANADAAVAYLVGGTRDIDIPATCSGTVLVACVGGLPADPLPQVHSVASNLSATRVSDTDPWSASADLSLHTLSAVPVSSSGVSCSLTYDSAGGSVATVHATATLTFLSSPDPSGPTNYIAVSGVSLAGIEDADIHIGGGGLCDFASALLPFFHGYVLSMFQSYLQGNICGAPDPEVFMPCPALP